MKVLIVAATEGEISPLVQHIASPAYANRDIGILITGVGMVATTYALTKKLQRAQYDLVIQAGVGGSFDTGIALGEVVFITSDQYGDLGAEDHDEYIDIFEMGLLSTGAPPHNGGKLLTPMLPVHDRIKLRHVSGLTINTVSGSIPTIKRRLNKYGCAVESMEGAAFHYVCLMEEVAFAQVRGISNYVIPRDKSQWKMKDAVVNLNKWLVEFIDNLND